MLRFMFLVFLIEICSKLHEMKSPVWHYNGNRLVYQHPYNLKRNVAEIVGKAVKEARGLELNDLNF
jgi:hypothetical protein